MYMIFTVHLNRLIDENTPSEQSTIETCLQEAHKYQKVTKISSVCVCVCVTSGQGSKHRFFFVCSFYWKPNRQIA